MGYAAGIDLGSSFTAVAVSRGGQSRMVALGERQILRPSVVRVQPNGSLAFGASGKTDVDDDPTLTARDFKRNLGDDVPVVLGSRPYSAVSLLAAMVRSVISLLTDLEGEPPERVVLTYPAAWGPHRREQFNEIPRRASLDPDIVSFVAEPVATATYYAAQQRVSEGDLIAIYDLGGGIFDAAVVRPQSGAGQPPGAGDEVRWEVLGLPDGVAGVGGVDFDEAILAHVDVALEGALSALDLRDPIAAIARQRLRNECARAKEDLSHATVTDIVVSLPQRSALVRLTRAELEEMIRPAVESTMSALRQAMKSAGVSREELAAVVLVGGSSRIPLVRRLLSEQLGRPVLIDPHPQQSVALGAAIIAENRSIGERDSLRTTEKPPPARSSAGTARRRPGRRLLAVGAATTLLIGVGAYAAASGRLTSGPPPPARAQTTAATTSPSPSLLAEASPSPTLSPSPSPDRPTKSASAKPKPSPRPKATPLLGFIGAVVGPGKKCMDVQNAVPNEGATVQIFKCNSTKAQQWNGGTHDTVRAYGKCLTASGTDAVDAYRVLLRGCNGGAAQRWTLSASTLVNQGSRRCLDTLGSKGIDYAPLVTRPCTGGASQHWRITE